jgi:hypothetical protein
MILPFRIAEATHIRGSNIPQQRLVSIGMCTDTFDTMSFLLTNDMVRVSATVPDLTNHKTACTFLSSISKMKAGNMSDWATSYIFSTFSRVLFVCITVH